MPPQISDIMAVESATRFRRPIYAGNAIITVEVAAARRSWARCAPPRSRRPAAGGSAAIESASGRMPRCRRIRASSSVSAAKSDRPDLQTAARVVSGGRALGSAESFKIIYSARRQARRRGGRLARRGGCGLRAQRLQVGQTGKIIAPELYIAIGISGRHPAPHRHQGRAHHRRDQQGSARRRSSRSPTSGWSATSSDRSPSSRSCSYARGARLDQSCASTCSARETLNSFGRLDVDLLDDAVLDDEREALAAHAHAEAAPSISRPSALA